METKWNKPRKDYNDKLPMNEQKRKGFLRSVHQNDYTKLIYSPVDISSLFRSDGMIHGVCL